MLGKEARRALKSFGKTHNSDSLQYFAGILGGYIATHPHINGTELDGVKEEIERFYKKNTGPMPPVLEGIRAAITLLQD